jgi:hypothetical protein
MKVAAILIAGILAGASVRAAEPTEASSARAAPATSEREAPEARRVAPPRKREPFGIVVPPAPRKSRAGPAADVGVTAKPFTHTHRVSASFVFEYEEIGPDLLNGLSALWPWNEDAAETLATRPVRSAVVVLEDDCGHYIKRALSNLGAVSIEWTPAGCENASLTIWSVAPLDGRRVGVGSWIKGPVARLSDLSTKSGDYRPFSYSRSFAVDSAEKNGGPGLDLGAVAVPFANDASRGFFLMDNVQTALDYYETVPGVSASELPKVNVVHTANLRPEGLSCADWDNFLQFAVYSGEKDPGFISIPWDDCADWGRDGHAVTHETAHYFHRHFLRQDDPDYGRFGEGMANVQAAIIRRTKWIAGGGGLVENLDVNSRMACWKDGGFQQIENDDGVLVDMRIDSESDAEECADLGGEPVFPKAVVWDDALNNSGWFQQIVYDLVDAGGSEPEPVTEFVSEGGDPGACGDCDAGQFDSVDGEGLNAAAAALGLYDVLIYYLGGDNAEGKNDHYEDRGLEGLDLSDVIDGFICRGHISADDANDIIAVAMGLDFDAAGGPQSCPHPED